MISERKKQSIKLIAALSILALLFIFVIIMMIKYEVEGETNMPFQLSKIVVVGTAEGVGTKVENNKEWNFDVYQSNDVYFYIDKNEQTAKEDDLIKSVKISDINVTKAPQKGTIKTYMPNSDAGRLFVYDDRFIVEEKLEYRGASGSSSTNLEIGSKGGVALIRFSNTSIGSGKDKEVIHDARLLKKINTTNEEIKFGVSCKITIETTNTKYQAEISLDLPTGNLDEEERCYLEKNDMSDVIFKRVK